MDPAYEMFGQFLYIANHFLFNFFLFKLSQDMLHNIKPFFNIFLIELNIGMYFFQ